MQQRTPLFSQLMQHAKIVRGNFYVPGHKGGNFFDEEAFKYYKHLLKLDATEVGELDDLHDPSGVIHEAQLLAADAFGAEKTFFLVGGTTAGNLAAILALVNPGDQFMMTRSSHQSIFHAALLARAVVHFLPTKLDRTTNLEMPLCPNELAELLRAHPQVKTVVITSPSYFGVVQPIEALTDVCHQFKIPLIVDEAHGAHFQFHENLPSSAMQAGADIAIQSTHKMLFSLTMSSMLHLQGNLICAEAIAYWLRVIESSSPSYLLMASLDVTRRQMALYGREKISEQLTMLAAKRLETDGLTNFQLLKVDDPFKFLFRVQNNQGYYAQEWLATKGHYAELAMPDKLLLCLSLGTTAQELAEVIMLLKELDQILNKPNKLAPTEFSFPAQETVTIDFGRQHKKLRKCTLTEAGGQYAAEHIIPYPPGIPLVVAGELITAEAIEYITKMMDAGGKVRGITAEEIHVLDT